jgi:hypothetical protein
MADMFMEWDAAPLVEPAFGDIDMPFIGPDVDSTLTGELPDEAGVVAATVSYDAGTTAATNGTRTRARTDGMVARGCADRRRAAGAGSSARAGTSGRRESPISATIGPLLGSVPLPVKSCPNPSPVTQ